MITKEGLQADLQKVEEAMQQLVSNYNVMQGQKATLMSLIEKFVPGVKDMVDGAVQVAEGIGQIAEGAAEVVAEV